MKLFPSVFIYMDGPGVSDVPREAEDRLDIPDVEIPPRPQDTNNLTVVVESLGESNRFIHFGNDIRYQTATPSNLSSAGTPIPDRSSLPLRPDTSQSPTTIQRNLVERTQTLLMECDGSRHTFRLSYWHQLKAGSPGTACICIITLHLWLSTLLASPDRHVLYLDPFLVQALLEQHQDNPLDLDADDMEGMLERHKLWPRMGPNAHIVALHSLSGVCKPDICGWTLLDLHVEGGQVTSAEILLPPSQSFDQAIISDYVTNMLGALNLTLPGKPLVPRSSKVLQRIKSLVLPPPFTEESIVLVMLMFLLGKMLEQDIGSVNLQVVRQSLCYYYNHALRSDKMDFSFPWPALTDSDGKLLTEKNSEEVGRRRFMLASNQEPVPYETFPRMRSYAASVSSSGLLEPFFLELAQSKSSHVECALKGTSGRSIDELEKALFLGQYPSWPSRFADRRQSVPEALSLEEFVELIHSLGGPENPASHRLLIIGKDQERRIILDWLKGVTYPLKEWLLAGYDIDSLSLTCFDVPELLEAGSYNPYPSRALSLTNRNELVVNVAGEPIEMHTCPNFCIMTFGANNQFRLLVFLPGCRNRVGKLWRNIPRESEMRDWYHIFLTALRMVSQVISHEWQHAVEKTIEALPASYEMASNQTNKTGGPRSFVGHRIEPVIMNHVFKMMRHIVDTTPRLALYKNYFFHLVGINLKLATQHIPGREDEDPLAYAFRIHRFINFCAQNPHDIVADVGLAINVDRASMPEELKKSTLLFRWGPLKELLRPAFRSPHQDCYCLSYTVGGGRTVPQSHIASAAGVIKWQGYPKDMVLTYRHRDKSIGANFTANEALGLGSHEKFQSQMKAFQDVVQEAGTYGVRLEHRLSAWAANRYMKMEPRDILDRMVDSEAILQVDAETPEVVLLTSVLAYWLKGLVKRPDEMSATRQMVEDLALVETAQTYGHPFLRSRALDDSGLRISYVIDAHTFKIIFHSDVIVPGGSRIKASRVNQLIPAPNRLMSPPASPARPRPPEDIWPNSSKGFLTRLVSIHLPRAMWDRFPPDRLAGSDLARQLRQRPLNRKHWAQVVEPLNTTVMIPGKFTEAMNKLFPPNWKATATAGDLASYDRDFLQIIRDHVDSKPAEIRSAYSAELRRRIRALLMESWDYLPSMHAHKMWTYTNGPAGQRVYRLCPRHS
ncbi:hypothetical protein RSOL_036590, partial [Rhizoctonia solani AG-3 Rhs1AP]